VSLRNLSWHQQRFDARCSRDRNWQQGNHREPPMPTADLLAMPSHHRPSIDVDGDDMHDTGYQ
jgi:hypothetical protein